MKTLDTRVRRAITAITDGRPVVVTGGTRLHDQAFLVFAAEQATSTLLAFTVRHTSGYVRVALPPAECDRLNLPPMCQRADGRSGAAFHRVAVDCNETGTGISATDRARTIAALASPAAGSADFRRPGHVIPVEAHTGGVLVRHGLAEAAVDLTRLAGGRPAAALAEIVSTSNPTQMASGLESMEFAVENGLAMVSVDELVAYRRRTEPQVVRVTETPLPTWSGVHRVIGFRGVHDDGEHLVVIVGTAGSRGPVPLHVHTECLCGDVFGSTACHCRAELDNALATMRAKGSGVIVYLRPCVSQAERAAQTVAWILRDLGVYSVRLSDDAPGFGLVMFGAIREYGLQVEGQTPTWAVAG